MRPNLDYTDRDLPDLLAAIGPQRRAESLLARRVRFHQSWYRAVVLGRDAFGRTMGPRPRLLGSILADADASAGLNFTSPAARRLFASRHTEGWGVDPVRSVKYLTSSQTLMINIFGLLAESTSWAARVLQVVLCRSDIAAVNWVKVEYAPNRRSAYLHDSTRLDVLLSVTSGGLEELLVIEVKYSDRFNSRRVDIDRPPYHQLQSKRALWRSADVVLNSADLNQLVRCHALAVALSDDLTDFRSRTPTLVVLHHDADVGSTAMVDRYRTHLAEHALVESIAHRAFVAALHSEARTRAQREAARSLQLRYIEERESELAWHTYSQAAVKG